MKNLVGAFRHDLAAGILGQKFKFIPVALFCFFVCTAFCRESIELTGITPSFLEYCLYLFKGMEPYDPESNEPFRVPYIWLFFHLYMAYLIGNYPQRDLSGVGAQILMRLQSRKIWWVSKCLWNLTSVLIYYFLIFSVVFLFSLCSGSLSVTTNAEIQNMLTGVNAAAFSRRSLICYVFLLPILTSMAVSMFQMVLSFLIRPVFSFVCIVMLYIISAYYFWFPYGNYTMLLRSAPVLGTDGYAFSEALIAGAVLLVLSVGVGAVYFSHYPILGTLQGAKDD